MRARTLVDHPYRAKILTAKEVAEIIGSRPRDKKVIMCHGTFDVIHPGHVRHLIYARSKADILVASLTCDNFIEKANFRPFVPEMLRAMNLAALAAVDYVIIDQNPVPLDNIRDLQPDYFAKGYEYVSDGLHPKTAEEKTILDEYGGEVIFTPGDVVYSSSSLIEMAPPNLAVDKLIALFEAEDISFDDLRSALDAFKGAKVHVVGDTIIDSYTETTMIGGQTKTPTISVRYENKTDFVGGAGIVAKHLSAAGADVTFTTVFGDDELRKFALDDLVKAGVTVNEIVDPTRPTTNKNAIVCGNYRMLKIDTLDNRAINEDIINQIRGHLESVETDAVVLSDFRHGIFNHATIPLIVSAIPENVFRVADSQVASRWGNILEFQNFDLLTPNEREARFALGDQDSVIRPLALRLYEEAKCRHLIMKMGERGLIGYRNRPDIEHDTRSFFVVDTFADRVVDPVGAGDALLSYSTLAHLKSSNEVIAAVLGALAASVECEHDGNVPVTPKDVIKKINYLERAANFGE